VSELLMPLARLPRPAGPVTLPDAVPPSDAPTTPSTGPPRAPGDPVVTAPGRATSSLARWGTAAAGATEPVLVLDATGCVISVSAAAVALLGPSYDALLRRPLADQLTLVDFETGAQHPDYAPRIPPLLVLRSGSLLRGLMRLDRPAGRITLDVISAPLREADGTVVGSLSFLAAIGAD
jgi:PAS domain-containing protein